MSGFTAPPPPPPPPTAAKPTSSGGGGGNANVDSNKKESMAENTAKPFAQRQFEKYDRDGNGQIDLSEFKMMLQDQGIVLSKEGIEVAMRELDTDGNKKITYEEYVAWKRNNGSWDSLSYDDVKLSARIRAAQTFDQFDTDKSGSLDRAEFRAFYDEMNSFGIFTETFEHCMSLLDSDGSGTIEFFEFCKWLDSIC